MRSFLLALAYRSWQLTGDDLVEDDLDDRRIAAALELELDDEELADQRIQTASEAAADAGGMGSNGEGGR